MKYIDLVFRFFVVVPVIIIFSIPFAILTSLKLVCNDIIIKWKKDYKEQSDVAEN